MNRMQYLVNSTRCRSRRSYRHPSRYLSRSRRFQHRSRSLHIQDHRLSRMFRSHTLLRHYLADMHFGTLRNWSDQCLYLFHNHFHNHRCSQHTHHHMQRYCILQNHMMGCHYLPYIRFLPLRGQITRMGYTLRNYLYQSLCLFHNHLMQDHYSQHTRNHMMRWYILHYHMLGCHGIWNM